MPPLLAERLFFSLTYGSTTLGTCQVSLLRHPSQSRSRTGSCDGTHCCRLERVQHRALSADSAEHQSNLGQHTFNPSTTVLRVEPRT